MPYAIYFWIVYIWAFFPEFKILRKSKKLESSRQDDGTIKMILVIQQISMLAAFGISFTNVLVLPWQLFFLIFGTCILICGSLLRRYCFRTLGHYFTGKVIVNNDQPVIDKGPYKLVRHPSYTAGIIMYLGIGTALSNIMSIFILFLGPCISYLIRVRKEEKALLEVLGERYAEYMKRTKRFIPYVI